jgi:protein N-terminal glutamine amidohydrolase
MQSDGCMVRNVTSDVTTNRNASETTAEETALSSTIQNDYDLRVPFYCEENIWRITYRKLYFQKISLMNNCNERYMVVFISNPNKCVPMYNQRSSTSPNKPCCWDYHVILLGVTVITNDTKDESVINVYDVDTTLTPYPIQLPKYLQSSFRLDYHRFKEYQPYFRIIPADLFIQHFASDRSHMYNPITKSYNEPPPLYSCIVPPKLDKCNHAIFDNVDGEAKIKSNLNYYLNFIQTESCDRPSKEYPYGMIVSLEELQKLNFSSL